MAFNSAKIEALAPDQAALDAARKLLKPGVWPTLASDDAGLVWGEAQGSGATPYRVVVCEIDAGYKCSCPSRKFPCKHSLALMWMRAEGKLPFARLAPPNWVNEWLSRRRGPSQAAPAADAAPKASIEAAASGHEPAGDPKAEARAAAQQERNRQARERSVLAGLDELDLWLSDQLERGVVAFVANAASACRQTAQRLVDAKASTLATRLDSLPSRLFSVAESARPHHALVELGIFHLIAEAYRRQDALDPAMREDVRQMVGWTQTREALLVDARAVRCAGRWLVIATRSEAQPDKLRRIETWLWREGEGGAPRFALLQDFAQMSAGAASAGFMIGEAFEAELVFYVSPVPLRALIAAQTSPSTTDQPMPALATEGLGAAWRAYEQALGARPWLGDWPFLFKGACVRRNGEALFLTDDADLALPISPDQAISVRPLAEAGPIDGVGLWDGWRMRLTYAEAALGRGPTHERAAVQE
jgi:SWIM zinc finger